MSWNIAPEWVSGVLIGILILYSSRGAYVNITRDRMFRTMSYVALLSISSNLLSTYMIYAYQQLPHLLVMAVTTIYFALTPLTPMVYMFYSICILYYNYSFERIHPKWRWLSVPYFVYLVMLLLNPFVHNIFCVLPGQGYVQQRYISAPYYVFYFYCLATMLLAIVSRKRTESRITRLVLTFPLIALCFIVVQLIVPQVILTGTAAFTTMLILFLYLQNQRLVGDELTGLLNRKMFISMLSTVAKSGRHFAILIISLRDFKNVNMRFGTGNGDKLLCLVAKYLSTLVSPRQLYRFSGDEFALLLREAPNESAEAVIEKLQHRFTRVWPLDGLECLLNVNFAVVRCPEAGKDADTLMSAIDYTLMGTKLQPNSDVFYYQATVREAHLRRREVAKLLKKAVENDEMIVYYQPIWSCKTQRFTQAEALLRMKPTPIGSLYPDEFIPIAEESGIIVEMTYQVLEKVCATIAALDALQDERVRLESISVNFSFVQFMQPHVEQRIMAILDRYSVSPSRIKIELTERVLVGDLPLVSSFMSRMHQQGLRFELDDFGTGFSNLSTLLALPLDVIKLDKSLVWSAMRHDERNDFMRCLVHGLHAIHISVIAEGVETEAHKNNIISFGCSAIQGFYFCKPMPQEQMIVFLRDKKNDRAQSDNESIRLLAENEASWTA